MRGLAKFRRAAYRAARVAGHVQAASQGPAAGAKRGGRVLAWRKVGGWLGRLLP